MTDKSSIREYLVSEYHRPRKLNMELTAQDLNWLLIYIKEAPTFNTDPKYVEDEKKSRSRLEYQVKAELMTYHHEVSAGVNAIIKKQMEENHEDNKG